jgi:hypothetical protein
MTETLDGSDDEPIVLSDEDKGGRIGPCMYLHCYRVVTAELVAWQLLNGRGGQQSICDGTESKGIQGQGEEETRTDWQGQHFVYQRRG